MNKRFSRYLLLSIVALSGLTGSPLRALEVWLDQIAPSVSLVGEKVAWEARSTPEPDGLCYQFSVAPPGSSFSVLRDFTCSTNRVEWAPMREGWYSIRVVARRSLTGETASAQATFEVISRTGGDNRPVVSPTEHPLVFLYSGPACQSGYMTVYFANVENPDEWRSTTPQPCDRLRSVNFWIAGLRPNSDYRIKHRTWDGGGGRSTDGPELTFRTGTVSAVLRPGTAVKWDGDYMNFDQGVLLESQLRTGAPTNATTLVARALDGTVTWYYDSAVHGRLQNMFRPLPGGDLLVVPAANVPSLREIDLAGNMVWETNAEAVSARLQALGHPPIGSFHHDALRLPGGTILALAEREQTIPSPNPGDPDRHVSGDVLILMDRNFEVLWVWDSFRKLDVNRKAILGETHAPAPGTNDPVIEDWTHGNAVEYLADGNLLFSMRSQDWVIKIDFRDGTGSGDVIWRLGKDGDFTLESSDAYPWFSHQHDPHFDGTRLWLYDNGNTRYQAQGEAGNSRGQVYLLDERTRTASLELSADLGEYSAALGSAERLGNGNYHFTSGILLEGSYVYSHSLEVSPDNSAGTIRYGYQVDSAIYRSFRMSDLYRPGR